MIADDPAEFAERCARLLSDDEDRRELGRRARAFVARHHSSAAYVSRMEATIAELVPSPSSSSD